MQHPIQITAAAPHDYEWCACLMASAEPWITLCRDLEQCRAHLARPGSELFVARNQDGEKILPLGFILLALYGFAGSPYIASVAVAAEAQGQGVGSQLLGFAEQHFRPHTHLFLLVSSFNQRARRFYRRHGYEFAGELPDYIVRGHSELIFHKRLHD